ncbi:hypothetical protein C8J57DRAFT_1310394 [Mycena rebaudengoi]|nr:hypothetical protein C8J57DRAFT_1310394 [Mycena rebaudengoi]
MMSTAVILILWRPWAHVAVLEGSRTARLRVRVTSRFNRRFLVEDSVFGDSKPRPLPASQARRYYFLPQFYLD